MDKKPASSSKMVKIFCYICNSQSLYSCIWPAFTNMLITLAELTLLVCVCVLFRYASQHSDGFKISHELAFFPMCLLLLLFSIGRFRVMYGESSRCVSNLTKFPVSQACLSETRISISPPSWIFKTNSPKRIISPKSGHGNREFKHISVMPVLIDDSVIKFTITIPCALSLSTDTLKNVQFTRGS